MQPYKIAHIQFAPNGEDMALTCTACNYSEDVIGYSSDNGAKPKKFVIIPFGRDGMQYIKCENCGELYNEPSLGR
jgi:ribosomal protein S27E